MNKHIADMAAAAAVRLVAECVEALRQILEIGGNLPDERLTSPTGPRDAAARGLMYVRARAIALAAIAAAKGEK